MSDALHEARIHCPYCGESITILIDSTEAGQSYIEDCQVCCRPMVICVNMEGDGAAALSEDEAGF